MFVMLLSNDKSIFILTKTVIVVIWYIVFVYLLIILLVSKHDNLKSQAVRIILINETVACAYIVVLQNSILVSECTTDSSGNKNVNVKLI